MTNITWPSDGARIRRRRAEWLADDEHSGDGGCGYSASVFSPGAPAGLYAIASAVVFAPHDFDLDVLASRGNCQTALF